MNKNLTWFDHAISSTLAFVVSAVIIVITAIALKLIWPIARFVVTTALTLVRTQIKMPSRRPAVPKMNNLPTPDIFKGAPNLAPAKQLKL